MGIKRVFSEFCPLLKNLKYQPREKKFMQLKSRLYSRFFSMLNHNTYRLVNKSQLYYDKIAGPKGKKSKHPEMIVNDQELNHKEPIAVLRFLVEFKRACDSNKILECVVLRVMLLFMKDGAASNVRVQMTSYGDDGAFHRLSKAGKKQISTHLKAIQFLLKSCAIGSGIAKAARKIATLKKKTPTKTATQLADVVRTKVMCSWNAYPRKRTKRVFTDGLPVNNQITI